METFNEKVTRLFQKHEALITRTNEPIEEGNGIFTRYKYPVVTAAHTPVFWRYDLNEQTNPYLMELIGMNAALNSGAISNLTIAKRIHIKISYTVSPTCYTS